MRVLITGMSGVGKSTLVRELRRRGCAAVDLDDDGFTAPRADGRWGWLTDRVDELLQAHAGSTLFVAGCSEEQAGYAFDRVVLLAAPVEVLLERLASRTTNTYGSTDDELAAVLEDVHTVEPLLRAAADVVLDAREPTERLADDVLRSVVPQ